jgi:hypothetical protein
MKRSSSSTPTLDNLKIRFNIRMFFGATLIAASFVSAYLISSSSNRMVTVWSAAGDLAPGSVISENDIKRSQVLLPDNAEYYLAGSSNIIGAHVIRAIGSTELIPAYAVSTDPISDLRRVPISIPSSRLPHQLNSGQFVDIYALPKQLLSTNNELRPLKAGLVLSGIAIEGINVEASKLGGEVGITLIVPAAEVSKLILAMAQAEFVLVKTQ